MVQHLPSPERRFATRVAVDRSVPIATDAGEREARVVNVSTSGMLLALSGELAIWSEVTIACPGLGSRAARVARRDQGHYGLVFREPLSAAEFADFTGLEHAPADPGASVPEVPPKRAGRTAPWAFGRDKLKTLRREAAERVTLEGRGWSG
jgi:hypothetical protein